MFQGYDFSAAGRLMRYVQIDTQSDPQSAAQPSTEKQKDLLRLLVEELKELSISDAGLDEWGYVYATLPANREGAPVICLCAHVDTAPDASGTGVRPLLHPAYGGGAIRLPDGTEITPEEFPYLAERLGDDIITASGGTLLGADDKSGVAIIMDAVRYLTLHPEVPHGAVRILFTPDEEIGRGTAKVDLQKLGADFGYTLDGGERGDLEDETFSADAVRVDIEGVIHHPGYAYGKLVNALKVAASLLEHLPGESGAPETTRDREGFIHPVRMEGGAERCTLEWIIRDFVTSGLQEKEARLEAAVQAAVARFPGARYTFTVTEQYRNMKEVLDRHPEVVQYAAEAIGRAGLTVHRKSIRGGTDGSRLSFAGLPCPNLFTGMQAIHSRKEFISVQDMNKAVETVVHLLSVAAGGKG